MAIIGDSRSAPERLGVHIKHRTAKKIGWGAIVGVVLGLTLSGLYFGLTQVNWNINMLGIHQHLFWFKPWWDKSAGAWLSAHTWFITPENWSSYRHNYRNLGAPALATVGVLSIVAGAKKPAGKLYLWLSPVLLVVSAAVLITLGTWVELTTVDHLHAHGVYVGTLSVAEALVIGFVIGRVVHTIMKPVGTRLQMMWVEWAVDRYWRKGGGPLPAWVRKPLVPPTAQETACAIIGTDKLSGEAELLKAKPLSIWSHLIWLAVALLALLLLGLTFLGGVGHLWVGILHHSFPYLAP